jgi:hypothetical protein
MEELVNRGVLFMRPLRDYVELEADELRGDPDEGLAACWQADRKKLEMKVDSRWLEIGSIVGPIRYSSDNLRDANVFCMYAFRGSQTDTLVDGRNLAFGDTFVVFKGGDESLRRARAAAQRGGLRLWTGLVEYVSRQAYHGHMGVFRKFDAFAYQSEFRLALLTGTGKPYSLPLGDLSDIALLGPLADLNARIHISRTTPEQPS